MAARLVELPLSLLDDHPKNPRLVFRQDVIDAIAANMNGEYPQQHALHVRPVGERYEVISGHHRKRAALAKGYETVWCWAEELDDEAAYMLLATANNQGELSPLEIGMHALHCVALEKGGRGKKGGIREYAERLGKDRTTINQYKSAAEVAEKVLVDQHLLLDKAQHLYAISALPEPCWQVAVEYVVSSGMSAADTKAQVEKAKAFLADFDAGEWLGYLPPERCAAAVFCGTDPNSFRKLLALADKVLESIAHDDLREAWRAWLVENAGGDSWDIRAVQERRLDLENQQWERDNAEQPQPEAVTLVLADPPWRYDFAETDNRQIENHYASAEPEDIIEHIRAPQMPPIADDCVLLMWATAPKLREALQVMEGWGFEYKTHAIWDKEKIGMGYWFRGQHELLLVGTRGNASPPEQAARVSSVFREARGEHSVKPECVYQWIEQAFPAARKLEMYCRNPRDGWLVFGNEAKE